MARTGRPKFEILTLALDERAALERLAARSRSARHMAFRAKIILRCADGGTNKDVGRALRVSRGTVGKWRSRFIADRLDGLHDEPRLGAARKITDDAVEGIVSNASKIRNLVLAKCVGLTDAAVESICKLGRNLHYLHLGHANG